MKVLAFITFILISSLSWALPSDLSSYVDTSQNQKVRSFLGADFRNLGAIESDVKFFKEGRSRKRINEYVIYLASSYYEQKHYQEAIWTLQDGGFSEAARKLSADVVRFLEQAPLDTHVKNLGGAQQYELSPHFFGILKGRNPLAEAFAYGVDQILELGIVPVTVLRNRYGDTYSLQAFVRTGRYVPGQESFRDAGYPVGVESLYLLDFLLDNSDRHNRNWLRRMGGNIFGFDHEYTLGFRGDRFSFPLASHLMPPPPVMERLRQADFEELSGMISKTQFAKFMKRREQALVAYDKIVSKVASISQVLAKNNGDLLKTLDVLRPKLKFYFDDTPANYFPAALSKEFIKAMPSLTAQGYSEEALGSLARVFLVGDQAYKQFFEMTLPKVRDLTAEELITFSKTFNTIPLSVRETWKAQLKALFGQWFAESSDEAELIRLATARNLLVGPLENLDPQVLGAIKKIGIGVSGVNSLLSKSAHEKRREFFFKIMPFIKNWDQIESVNDSMIGLTLSDRKKLRRIAKNDLNLLEKCALRLGKIIGKYPALPGPLRSAPESYLAEPVNFQ